MAAQNLLKRDYGYFWRRSLVVGRQPITLVLSLRTKALAIARRRGALMTAKSEDVRVSLYEQIQREGLTHEQQLAVFRAEMSEYRNALHHLAPGWDALRDPSVIGATSNLRILGALWSRVAESGADDITADEHDLRRTLPMLEPLERQSLSLLLEATPAFRSNFAREVAQRLASFNIDPTTLNEALAGRLVAGARATAARDCLDGAPVIYAFDEGPAAPTADGTPPATAAPRSNGAVPITAAIQVPADWRTRTALQIAKIFIATNPKMFAHRAEGKRGAQQTGEQSQRQILWAAQLIDKSLGGRPYHTRTLDDIIVLDCHFDRLPISFGKSPAHREPDYTLERAEAEAIEALENGEIDASMIGFMTGTTNKHFRGIARVDRLAREAIPELSVIDFARFCTTDLKHERDARRRISNEQAVSLFGLPPWTGCVGEEDRITPGDIIIHDGLYFAPLMVWYTGARREEICKLLVTDIGCMDGIWYIFIDHTETGRVKNKSAVRVVAICDELLRLGLIEYVEAMKAAGEKLLFPEFMPGGATKRKLGDVFYKLWWIYLAPLVVPALIRGQAMHSCRHAVSDELKAAEIFLETRNDLFGHTGNGGEGETRYPAATKLPKLKVAVDLIPVVTAHLPSMAQSALRLLSPERRTARPTRNKEPSA